MVTKKTVKPAEKKYVTDSNIPIKPFYQKSTKKQAKEEPGKFPFTRGIHAGMYRDRFWTCVNMQDLVTLHKVTSDTSSC